MTRMHSDTKPVDAATVLAGLAAFWADPQPSRYDHRIPERIAGGKHDQPVPRGTQNPYWEIIRQMPLSTITMTYQRIPQPDPHFFLPGEPVRLLADRHSLCTTYALSLIHI